MVRRPQLQSPLARAVVPVGVGIVFFAILALALWGVASLISNGDAKSSDLLTGRKFQPGPAASYARIVEADGPIIFPDLLGTDGDKTIVLDHTGEDPTFGWVIYLAHPADRPIDCKVEQVRLTRQFTDCEGRTIDVGDLAPPARGIVPIVEADGTLNLNLVPVTASSDPAVAATTSTIP